MLWRSVEETPVHVLFTCSLRCFYCSSVEVLDALMDHLEETLQMVISKGENLVLDNKGVKVLS